MGSALYLVSQLTQLCIVRESSRAPMYSVCRLQCCIYRTTFQIFPFLLHIKYTGNLPAVALIYMHFQVRFFAFLYVILCCGVNKAHRKSSIHIYPVQKNYGDWTQGEQAPSYFYIKYIKPTILTLFLWCNEHFKQCVWMCFFFLTAKCNLIQMEDTFTVEKCISILGYNNCCKDHTHS